MISLLFDLTQQISNNNFFSSLKMGHFFLMTMNVIVYILRYVSLLCIILPIMLSFGNKVLF